MNSSAQKDKDNQKSKFLAAGCELDCGLTPEEFAKKLKSIGSVKPLINKQVNKKK